MAFWIHRDTVTRSRGPLLCHSSTINNLINSMRRRCVALREANGGHTRYPPNTVKMHILEWLFIVASLRHTCAIIILSNQHLDMPHLWGGWIISAKEKCSLTQIYTDLWTIFERNRPFVYIEKVLDLWVQLVKNGGKNNSCVYNFVQYNYYIIISYLLQYCNSYYHITKFWGDNLHYKCWIYLRSLLDGVLFFESARIHKRVYDPAFT